VTDSQLKRDAQVFSGDASSQGKTAKKLRPD